MEPDVYLQVKTTIKKILNIDLNYYKEDQVKRRLDSWLARNNMTEWSQYFALVNKDEKEKARFRDFLTINVTEFFRDMKYWDVLMKDILPTMVKEAAARKTPLKLWSAGCSIGIEAYTLAMAMDKVAPTAPYELLASDMDRGALQKARARGPYLPDESRNMTPAQIEKYLDKVDGKFFFKERFTHSIRFFEQDLLLDDFTGGFDLIVCRNVVIYFTRDAKDMLYKKFKNALRPGGILFVGGTELLPRPSDYGFESKWMAFYSKV